MCRARHADSLPPDSLSMRSPPTLDRSFATACRARPSGSAASSCRSRTAPSAPGSPPRECPGSRPAGRRSARRRGGRPCGGPRTYETSVFISAPSPVRRPSASRAPSMTTRSPAVQPGQHFDLVAVVRSGPHRAALDAVVPHHEHDRSPRPTVRTAAFGTSNRGRAACRPAPRGASLKERHLDAHVGQDARVELVEADPHPHRRLLPVGRRDGRDDVRRESASPDRRRAPPRPAGPA